MTVDIVSTRLRLLSILARRHDRDRTHRLGSRAELRRIAGHVSKAQAGAFGRRFSNCKEGASSCAWPGTRTKSTSRPAASQTPTILLLNPPLERPRAWAFSPVLRLSRRLNVSVFDGAPIVLARTRAANLDGLDRCGELGPCRIGQNLHCLSLGFPVENQDLSSTLAILTQNAHLEKSVC